MTDASNQQIVGDELNEVRSQLQNALGQSLAGLPTDRRIADEDGFSYAQPVQDPYGKAIRYLEKHNIMQLFQVCKFKLSYIPIKLAIINML